MIRWQGITRFILGGVLMTTNLTETGVGLLQRNQTPDEDSIVTAGKIAVQRYLEDSRDSFDNNLAIGRFIDHLENRAVRESHSRETRGKKYSDAIKVLLAEYHLDKIGKTKRSQMKRMWLNQSVLRPWHESLPDERKIELNAASSVLKEYRKDFPDKEKPEKTEKKETTTQANARLQAEVEMLKKQLQDGGGDVFDLRKDQPKHIVRVILDTVTESKAKQIYEGFREVFGKNGKPERIRRNNH
jgi:hypothetical protein